MFRFIFGLAVGLGLAWLTRSKYVEDMRLEQKMADMQRKSEAILLESRHILDETRHELQAAAEAGLTSIQHKADRIRTAVEHPEVIERETAAHREPERRTETRPSRVE